MDRENILRCHQATVQVAETGGKRGNYEGDCLEALPGKGITGNQACNALPVIL